MSPPPLIDRLVIISILSLLALCSCEVENACSRYEEVCPRSYKALCIQLLESQSSDELTQCIQAANSCDDIYQCLTIE